MADAFVTVKLSPTEFDLVRRALRGWHQAQIVKVEQGIDLGLKAAARKEAIATDDVITRLGA